MLHDFVVENREEIIERTRALVRERTPQKSIEEKLEHGVPLFLTQLVDALPQNFATMAASAAETRTNNQQIIDSAEIHGHQLLKGGFTLAQVVHGYGDICQVVTSLASEARAAISTDDFQVFNRCLDDAIASAVTAYGMERERALASEGTLRLGVLGHELRNLLSSAIMGFDVVRRGTVGLGGSTGALIARNLAGLSVLIDRTLAEVRLNGGLPKLVPVSIVEFMDEIEVAAAMQAEAQGLRLVTIPAKTDVVVNADRLLLTSAVSNLIQNAFKFTRPGTIVAVTTRASEDRVLIEVGDECGGLPPGRADELFEPYSQRGSERSGLGLGLSIALSAARAHGGDISARDIPGGCAFTLELPRWEPAPAGRGAR